LFILSELHRDIEEKEKYSQEDATKILLQALHDSDDPQWLDIFKQALATERMVLMHFPSLNLSVNGQTHSHIH